MEINEKKGIDRKTLFTNVSIKWVFIANECYSFEVLSFHNFTWMKYTEPIILHNIYVKIFE